MKKWEYCVIGQVVWNDKNGLQFFDDASLTIITDTGSKVTNTIKKRKDSNNMTKLIAQLGEQGWEMVGCGTNYEGRTHNLYFKRPIE